MNTRLQTFQDLSLSLTLRLGIIAFVLGNGTLFDFNWGIAVATLAAVLWFPGASFLRVFRFSVTTPAILFPLTVAISLCGLMVISALASFDFASGTLSQYLGWPAIGVGILSFTLLADLIAVLRAKTQTARRHGKADIAEILVSSALGALTLIFALFAISSNNASPVKFSPLLVASTLVAVALLLLPLLLPSKGAKHYLNCMALFAGSLVFFWQRSISGDFLFGYDIQQEYSVAIQTQLEGSFQIPEDGNAYEAMLSLTSLPMLLSEFSGVPTLFLFKVVFPIFLSLALVASYAACTQMGSQRSAYAATSILVLVAPSFANQFPALVRQEVALVIFASFVALLVSQDMAVGKLRILLAILGSSLAFTHYTTSYLTIAVLAAGLIIRDVARVFGVRRMRNELGHRSNPSIRERLALSWTLLLVVFASSFVWNVLITRTSSEAIRLAGYLEDEGLQLLPNTSSSLLEQWLRGTAPRTVSAQEFEQLVRESYENKYDWLTPHPLAEQFPLRDLEQTSAQGLLEGSYVEVLDSMNSLAKQGVLVLVILSIGFSLHQLFRRESQHPRALEIVAVACSALLFLAAFRISGALTVFYNAERVFVQLSFLIAPLVALMLAKTGFVIQLLRLCAAVSLCVNLSVQSGLQSILSGKGTPVSFDRKSEDASRFLVSTPEYEAGTFLKGILEEPFLIQTDRYGILSLNAAGVRESDGVLTALVPRVIDTRAYVFASSTNILLGSSRGIEQGNISVYVFPGEFLKVAKQRIYNNGYAEIYR